MLDIVYQNNHGTLACKNGTQIIWKVRAMSLQAVWMLLKSHTNSEVNIYLKTELCPWEDSPWFPGAIQLPLVLPGLPTIVVIPEDPRSKLPSITVSYWNKWHMVEGLWSQGRAVNSIVLHCVAVCRYRVVSMQTSLGHPSRNTYGAVCSWRWSTWPELCPKPLLTALTKRQTVVSVPHQCAFDLSCALTWQFGIWGKENRNQEDVQGCFIRTSQY